MRTAAKIPDAIAVMRAWGFSYRTVFLTWIKTTQKGAPALGLGRYTRSSTEFLLLGIRGRVSQLLSGATDASGIVQTPRTRHSAKPSEAVERIDYVFSGPAACKKVELFARGHVDDLACQRAGIGGGTRSRRDGAKTRAAPGTPTTLFPKP